MFKAYARAFPYATPTNNAPTKPGPYVQATKSTSLNSFPASFNAAFVTSEIASTWFLEAISGSTPPNFSCILI